MNRGRGGGGFQRGRPFHRGRGPSRDGSAHSADSRDGGEGSSRGGGRGARGGGLRPPPGLKGKEIGLWYRKNQIQKSREQEIQGAVQIDLDEQCQERLKTLMRKYDEEDGVRPGASKDSCAFSSLLEEVNVANKNPRVLREMESKVERIPEIDELLLSELEEKGKSRNYGDFQTFRKTLPAFECKDRILESVRNNQVVVVSGETGCGKTTQVGQYILDDMIIQGKGSVCNVLCTQPRRISAVSVAERVAEERGEKVGGNAVGYVIRLESRRPKREQGTITFCTTGVVFRYLKDDPYLTKYSHLILDEVHERDHLCDILITLLKDLLVVRPDLKIILMSATINANKFSEYFGNCPMFNIPGMTFPVQEFYLEDIVQSLKYKFEDTSTDLSDGGKLRRVYFEERDYEAYLKSFTTRVYRDNYKKETIRELCKPESERFEYLLDLTLKLLEHIRSFDKDRGAILIFVTGWDEISKLINLLEESGKFPSSEYLIFPLHSMMPTVNQRQIFERPPAGVTKIIISTNIAETSITIDDIKHVIDFGKIKMTTFDKNLNLECLDTHWASKANIKQRKGRAGRTSEGYCFHLFSKARESRMEDFIKPEILRKRLEEVVLTLTLLKLGNLRYLFRKLLDPPSRDTITLSYDRLKMLNALDSEEDLTPLGYHLACLPMHPEIGKLVLLGAVFSAVDPVFSIAASLSFKDPFVMPMGKENLVDKVRQEFAAGSKSDHWAIAQAMNGYERAERNYSERHYCFQNFLSQSACKMLVNFKRQFGDQMYKMSFLASPNPKDPANNLNSSNIALVKAVVCAGLYPNVAKVKQKHPNSFPKFKTNENGIVHLHKKSVNANEKEFECPFVVYHMKQKLKKITLFDTTMISPYPLVFFGASLKHVFTDGVEIVEIDGAFRFKISKENFVTIESLRQTLDKVLSHKIAHPSPTNWDSGSVEGQLLIGIRELITSQYDELMRPLYDSDD